MIQHVPFCFSKNAQEWIDLMRGSRKFFQRASNYFFTFFNWLWERGSKYHYKRAITGPPAKRHLNCSWKSGSCLYQRFRHTTFVHTSVQDQVRSQAETRKSGHQHHTGLDARTPDYVACKQEGAYHPAHPRSLISAFSIRYLKSKATGSDISRFSK